MPSSENGAMQAELDRCLKVALAAAEEAGRVTLEHFHGELGTSFKQDGSPVTVADLAAERAIRSRLEQEFPDHDIVGEEEGEDVSGSAFRWYVDPIDGTKSFVCGVPLYAVLLGLELEGESSVGVVHFPALGETLWARRGSGAFLNGRQVRVSACTDLSQATMAFTDAGNFRPHGRQEAFERLVAASRVRAGWGDAYGHSLVASGRIELMLDPVMNPWDCGPFPVLLREAGGYFGSWSGEEGMHHGEAISTSRELLGQVLDLVAGRAGSRTDPA